MNRCHVCHHPYAVDLYEAGQCCAASCEDRGRRHTHWRCDNPRCPKYVGPKRDTVER